MFKILAIYQILLSDKSCNLYYFVMDVDSVVLRPSKPNLFICIGTKMYLFVGFVLIILGSFISITNKKFFMLVQPVFSKTSDIAVYISEIGAFIIFLGILGYYGLACGWKILLYLYLLGSSCVFVLQLSLGSACSKDYEANLISDNKTVIAAFATSMDKYKKYKNDSSLLNAIESLFIAFKCCGLKGQREFGKRPPNICRKEKYTKGCTEYLIKYIKFKLFLLQKSVFISTVFEAYAIIVTSLYLCYIHYKQRVSSPPVNQTMETVLEPNDSEINPPVDQTMETDKPNDAEINET